MSENDLKGVPRILAEALLSHEDMQPFSFFGRRTRAGAGAGHRRVEVPAGGTAEAARRRVAAYRSSVACVVTVPGTCIGRVP